MGTGPAVLRIGELARRTDTSPELLRAWERRYGLVQPMRTKGGFRLYSESDERRIRQMHVQLAAGISAAEAARIVLAGENAQTNAIAGEDGAVAEILAALESYDGPAVQAVFDRLLATYGESSVVVEVVLPALRELGDRWREGRVTVGQEHFASAVLRGRLLGLARAWDQGVGPRALLACPPGEMHDLGLLAFGLVLRGDGWRIVFLGADVPVDSLTSAVGSLQPAVIVLSAVDPRHFRNIAADIAGLGSLTPLRLGGRAAEDALGAELDPLRLPADPVEAAAALAPFH